MVGYQSWQRVSLNFRFGCCVQIFPHVLNYSIEDSPSDEIRMRSVLAFASLLVV